jgi:hypothetical protein
MLKYQREERIKLTQQLICNLSDSFEEAKDLGFHFNDYNEFIESKIKDCLFDRDSSFSQMVDNSIDRVQISTKDMQENFEVVRYLPGKQEKGFNLNIAGLGRRFT